MKSKGDFIVLLRVPLMRNRYTLDEKYPGSWRDSNDNFGGQWLSRDGKALHYCQARVIPRFPPFRTPYDNLPHANRILVVWRTTDGLKWRPTLFCMPTEDDPVGYQHYGAHVYTLEGGDLFLAELNAYNARAQQIYIELVYSRDGVLWHRFRGQPAFAPNGPFGSFNFGHHFAGNPIERDGTAYQILHYCNNRVHFYSGMIAARPGRDKQDLSGLTASWLQEHFKGKDLTSWPFWKHLGSWEGLAEDARKASQTVGLMRYRKDGRTSIAPEGRRGSFLTKVLSGGRSLSLNARTSPEGSIRVEVSTGTAKLMTGYSGENAAVFTGDSIDYPLTWSNGKIKELPAHPVRLRITIDRADLFALNW